MEKNSFWSVSVYCPIRGFYKTIHIPVGPRLEDLLAAGYVETVNSDGTVEWVHFVSETR